MISKSKIEKKINLGLTSSAEFNKVDYFSYMIVSIESSGFGWKINVQYHRTIMRHYHKFILNCENWKGCIKPKRTCLEIKEKTS